MSSAKVKVVVRTTRSSSSSAAAAAVAVVDRTTPKQQEQQQQGQEEQDREEEVSSPPSSAMAGAGAASTSDNNGERPLPTPSPDTAKCAICLGDLQDKCYSNTCCHEFCYGCLVKWSEVKPECPLCKSTFQSIYYNIRSMSDFDEYIVPVNPPPPMPHLSLRINTDNYAPPEVIIRSRGNLHDYSLPHFRIGGRSGTSHSFLRDPQRYISIMQIGFNPSSRSMLMQPEAIDLTLQGTMIPNENPFYSEAPELFGHTLDLSNSIFSSASTSSSNTQFSGYQMRRRRYDREQWVRPFDSALNPGASAVFPSVEYFQRSSADIRRISPWLHRELTVLLSLRRSRTEMAHIYDVIIALLRRYDIRSQEFREHIRAYFGNNARQFQHEFFHFVLSGYSMEEYDRVAVYRESDSLATSTASNVTGSVPPVFTIDSDDEPETSNPSVNQQPNLPSTSGTRNSQGPSYEIVISDDDSEDDIPAYEGYYNFPRRHRTPRRRRDSPRPSPPPAPHRDSPRAPLSPALNEEEYHMLTDMLEGSSSRHNRGGERRGAQHRNLSPTTEEFLGALDPFDLSDPPTNHHSDLLDFDFDASRPHSSIDLNNLSSGNRAQPSSSRPSSSSRNISTNNAIPSSGSPDLASHPFSEALMRFVDNNPINPMSSSTPRGARERASATIDMIGVLRRTAGAAAAGLSRRDRGSNVHDPADGRRNPRPPRYACLFDEPRRPTRRCSGRSSDTRRSVIWERQLSELDSPTSPPDFNDDSISIPPLPLDTSGESGILQSGASTTVGGAAGSSSVQIRIFPPAIDLSSRTSNSAQAGSSASYLSMTSSGIQARSSTNSANLASTNGSGSAPQDSNRPNSPDEECEFLGVQPVYKKPPLAVITLSSDDDDDETNAHQNLNNSTNTTKTEPTQSSSNAARDPYGDFFRTLRMSGGMFSSSSSRLTGNSNAELSSLPTENMVERHLDAVASGFAYPMSMSSSNYLGQPSEQNRIGRNREELISSDSEDDLGGSDQVPSTSSLFRAYEVYPSSENNICDPRGSSARSSSVEFDLLSIPNSSSSNDEPPVLPKQTTKSKKKISSSSNDQTSKSSKNKRKASASKKNTAVEKTSTNQPGPSKQTKRNSKSKTDAEKLPPKKKLNKYKRVRSQSRSSTDEEDNFPALERISTPVASKKRARPDSSPCLPDISDPEEDYTPKKKRKVKKSKGKKSKSKSSKSKKEKKSNNSDNDQEEQSSELRPSSSLPRNTEPEPAIPSSSQGEAPSNTLYFNPAKKLKSLVFKVQKPAEAGSSRVKPFAMLSDSSSDESEFRASNSKDGKQKRLRSVVTTPVVNKSTSSVSSACSSNATAFKKLWSPMMLDPTKSDSSSSQGSNFDNSYSMTSSSFPCVPRKKLLRRWESEDDESHAKESEQATGLPSFDSNSSSDEDFSNNQQRRTPNESDSDDDDDRAPGLKSSTKPSSLPVFF